MKFNLKSFALLVATALMGFTSCSDDKLLVDDAAGSGADYSGKKVYLTAGLALPSDATTAWGRSSTDSGDVDHAGDDKNGQNGSTNSNADPDFEYGYDYENDVRTLLLVFATKSETDEDDNNKFLFYSIVDGIDKAPTGTNYSFSVTAEIKYEDLEKAYAKGGLLETNQYVNVYAYCNYTANLEALFKDYASESPTMTQRATGKEWLDFSGKIEEEGSPVGSRPTIDNTIWAQRSFLMTNHAPVSTKFPAKLTDWDPYANEDSPFLVTEGGKQATEANQNPKLLPIYVERSAARIDFRDGSRDPKDATKTYDNTYLIYTEAHKYANLAPTETQEDTTLNLFNVQLTRMALVNMSKNFYYLRRVSSNGMPTGAEILGAEGLTNYVVDTDAADKKLGIKHDKAPQYFNFPLFTSAAGEYTYNKTAWYADRISDVLNSNKTDDTWTGSQNNRYKIWRYITENTIPSSTDDGTGTDQQKVAQSTGVVFKGKIKAGKDIAEPYSTKETVDPEAKKEYYVSEKVRNALNDVATVKGESPILYYFDGFLYAGWEELVDAAYKDGKGGRLFAAVEKILSALLKYDEASKTYTSAGTGKGLDVETAYDILHKFVDDKKIDEKGIDDAKVKALSPVNNITVYEATDEGDSDGWGYYCYYFYWIRHNDNLMSGLMGVMEFATVRNNVYKLYVESIGRFGHPTDPKDDPDPKEEDDPDEDPLRYIRVNVDVLPWVVRENPIKF